MTYHDMKKKYRMTNAGIAERFGIPLRTVESWSAKQRVPHEYVLRMMQELLEADAAWRAGRYAVRDEL